MAKTLRTLIVFFLALAVTALAQNITNNPHESTQPHGQIPFMTSPQSTTITESSDPTTITVGNSVSCNSGAPGYYHTDNSYFRAFNLSDFGINNQFNVTTVQIGVEQAVSGSGTQPVTCNLYTSSQNFPTGYPGSLTLIGTVSDNIPDQNLTLYNFSVTGSAPAGSQLVVEIFTPNGSADSNSFFIGSNASPETAPSYLLAADCGITTPTTTSAIGFPNMHIVMSVTGDEVVPVELTSFSAVDNHGSVILNWSTATETNNQRFEIQRNSGSGFATVGFVNGNGTSTQAHDYTYTDNNVNQGSYSYRLKQIDFNGSFTYSNVINLDVTAPAKFELIQNFPNPFNPTTKISFNLAVDSKVKIAVFNLLGQEVTSLVNGNYSAGIHNVTFNAVNLNSGVYFYRLEAEGNNGQSFTAVKKMILTK